MTSQATSKSAIMILAVAMLAGCGQRSGATRHAHAMSQRSDQEIVTRIRVAGHRDKSAIEVAPLRDPAVLQLTDQAYAAEAAGRYQDAANTIDQALKITPKAPELLQYRAELAIRLHEYKAAVDLANQSFLLGPRMGSLCARNWQTIVEMREHSGHTDAAASARKQLARCQVDGPIRM